MPLDIVYIKQINVIPHPITNAAEIASPIIASF
jgi:hypothetical protein